MMFLPVITCVNESDQLNSVITTRDPGGLWTLVTTVTIANIVAYKNTLKG